jgi:hypothetical protein
MRARCGPLDGGIDNLFCGALDAAEIESGTKAMSRTDPHQQGSLGTKIGPKWLLSWAFVQ